MTSIVTLTNRVIRAGVSTGASALAGGALTGQAMTVDFPPSLLSASYVGSPADVKLAATS